MTYIIFVRNWIKNFIESVKSRWFLFSFNASIWRGLVIEWLYWLFLSIFKIADDILFVRILTSINKSNKTSFSLSFKRICESKANLVFTLLNPPIIIFSNTLRCSTSVGRAIKHLLWSLCAQLLKELAELHLRELKLYNF